MNDFDNRRRFTRVNVDDQHTVRFHLREQERVGLTMTNLSAGGCCVKVPQNQSEGLEKGTPVELLYLVHRKIPSVPLRATICWLLGKQAGRTDGYVLVGFEFTDISPQYQEVLETYVEELVK
jgi:c-di-GMP-binding flagellar brake protein YcgR